MAGQHRFSVRTNLPIRVKQIFAVHPLCLLAVLLALAAPRAQSQNLSNPAGQVRDPPKTIRLPAEETIKSWMAEHKVPV